MRRLTPEQLGLAVVIAVCERKSRSRLKDRVATSIIEDCMSLFEDPRLCPTVRKLNLRDVDHSEFERRQLCAETLALFETIEPIVRVLERR